MTALEVPSNRERTEIKESRRSGRAKRIRWAVLDSLAKHSSDFCHATETLANRHPIPLSLLYFEVERVALKVLGADGLPRTQRPPKKWREASYWEYLWGLSRLCRWFGLRDADFARSTDWAETLHYWLQARFRALLERPSFGYCYTYDIPESNPLPWLSQPPRGRGRPALAPGHEWEVLEACTSRRLLGQSWEEIAKDCGLTNRRGLDVPPFEIATRCRRLAKRLGISRPL